MPILVDIIVALCLISYNSFEFLRINVFKIDKNALFVGLTSTISIGFGLYLCIITSLVKTEKSFPIRSLIVSISEMILSMSRRYFRTLCCIQVNF